jgi:hypothetical protein
MTTRAEVSGTKRRRLDDGPTLLQVPPCDIAAVDGHGSPDSEEFQEALRVLYSYSYPVSIAMRRAGLSEEKVPPLEALWWMGDGTTFDAERREDWHWTAMIRQPESVPDEIVRDARQRLSAKLGEQEAARLRLDRFDEGLCAQLVHHGPFSEEPASVARLHEFIAASGHAPRGRHHEIYLSNPQRARPDRMRTILRQPVQPAG